MNSLEETKRLAIDKIINSYKNWLDHFLLYLENEEISMKNPDSTEVMSWVEAFHSSSEKIGKILQNIRFLHQEIIFHSKLSKNNTLFKIISDRKEYYTKLISQFISQMLGYLEDCKDLLSIELKEDQRILVIDMNNQWVGIMVDRMQQVIRVGENSIDIPPSILQNDKKDSLLGIVKLNHGSRLILLVDEKKLFSEHIFDNINKKNIINSNNLKDTSGNLEKDMEEDEVQIVTFKLGKEEFGLYISDVREINRITDITAVPNVASFVEGIMNLRGNVIPIIDLRKRFNLINVKRNDASRVLIVDIANKTTGLIVDSVSDVLRIAKNLIEPPPDIIGSNIQTEFISSIANLAKQGRFIILLNVNRILSGIEKEELKAS
jgi:chemotaxis signal transduction protein